MVEHSHKTTSSFYTAGFQAEALPPPPQTRLTAGVFYGLWLGLIYTLSAGVIDALVMRDVPIRVDWTRLWGALVTTGLGVALLSAVTAWPVAPWRGMMLGAALYVGWLLLQSFLKLQGLATIFLIFFLPLALLSLPITAVLRWAIEWHLRHRTEPGPQRLRAQMLLLALVFGVGAFAGSWAQMPPAAQEAVRTVHRLLQRALTQPAEAQWPPAFAAVPALRDHRGSRYGLTQRASAASLTGVEVIAVFDDGFALTCLVDAASLLTQCVEGHESIFGSFQFNPNDQR